MSDTATEISNKARRLRISLLTRVVLRLAASLVLGFVVLGASWVYINTDNDTALAHHKAQCLVMSTVNEAAHSPEQRRIVAAALIVQQHKIQEINNLDSQDGGTYLSKTQLRTVQRIAVTGEVLPLPPPPHLKSLGVLPIVAGALCTLGYIWMTLRVVRDVTRTRSVLPRFHPYSPLTWLTVALTALAWPLWLKAWWQNQRYVALRKTILDDHGITDDFESALAAFAEITECRKHALEDLLGIFKDPLVLAVRADDGVVKFLAYGVNVRTKEPKISVLTLRRSEEQRLTAEEGEERLQLTTEEIMTLRRIRQERSTASMVVSHLAAIFEGGKGFASCWEQALRRAADDA